MPKPQVKNSWLIPSQMRGLRADQYLKIKIGRISREKVKKIINAKQFLLDEKSVKPSQKIHLHQVASLIRTAPDSPDDIQKANIKILFENKDIIVLDKPYGLNIHPSANSLYKTLTFWLKINFPKNKINPCHRIDKETSGIVVCAKNRATESLIKKSFMHGKIDKSYLAIVHGQVSKQRTINFPLALQKERGLVAIRMIRDEEGKYASTRIRPLKYFHNTNRTLLLCKPKTGRQHQIRAHLSLIDHPIIGDKLYSRHDEYFDKLSKNESVEPLEHFRHALHSYRLRIKLKNFSLNIKSPLPKDFYLLIGGLPNISLSQIECGSESS